MLAVVHREKVGFQHSSLFRVQEAEEFNCLSVINLFAPRRNLLPRRIARTPEPGSSSTPRQLEIVVQAGVDLPVRVDDESGTRTRPFVEISFQGNKKATTLKAGANPIWNQLIHLEMTAPGGDWSQDALVGLPDEISFNLFDNVRKSEPNVREGNGVPAQNSSWRTTSWDAAGAQLTHSALHASWQYGHFERSAVG